MVRKRGILRRKRRRRKRKRKWEKEEGAGGGEWWRLMWDRVIDGYRIWRDRVVSRELGELGWLQLVRDRKGEATVAGVTGGRLG